VFSDNLLSGSVIPAKAGIRIAALDSRLRGNDGQTRILRCHDALVLSEVATDGLKSDLQVYLNPNLSLSQSTIAQSAA
jgi:hypothetical protein